MFSLFRHSSPAFALKIFRHYFPVYDIKYQVVYVNRIQKQSAFIKNAGNIARIAVNRGFMGDFNAKMLDKLLLQLYNGIIE